MKNLLVALLVALSFPGFLHADPPSDESVREVLTLTQAQKLVGTMLGQMDSLMDNATKQAIGNHPVTPEVQAVVDKNRAKMVDIFKEELSWEKMEPLYLSVYKDSFTQEEIDGLIAFYKSPAGQAFVKKMPVVMQKTMVLMQQRMGPMMEKIRAMEEDTAKDLGK